MADERRPGCFPLATLQEINRSLAIRIVVKDSPENALCRLIAAAVPGHRAVDSRPAVLLIDNRNSWFPGE